MEYTINERVKKLLIIIVIAISALILRLLYIQFLRGNEISHLADELWSREIPVEGQRGNIYDRNGRLIVGNKLAPSVVIVPRQVKDKERTAKFLSDTLELSYEKALDYVNKNVSVQELKPEGRKIAVDKAQSIIVENLPGVYIASDTERYYPEGDFLAHSLGFSGIDNQGITGIEYIYDDYLMGLDGSYRLYTDAKGGTMHDIGSIYVTPTTGLDMHLTVDLELQSILERVLSNAVVRYNPDQVLGLIMNPKTGEILSMSSRPTFEPENYQDYDQEIYNRNLPIWMNYEPGSTFKIITYAAGLEEEAFELDESFYDPGFVIVDGARIKDWKAGGHGEQNFLEVIQNSCNIGFVEIGQRLGTDVLFDYIDDFGFGTKTGIDLLGESSGIIFDKEVVGPVELATAAFGQGNSVTPIQLVTGASAAINGGNLMQPHILKGFSVPTTSEMIYEEMPVVKRQVISEQTSNVMKMALENVAARGTGRGSYIEGYRVGGKTGTAQKVGEDGQYMDNNYILSFLGMAPMNDPEIAVYIAIDNPKNTIQYGGVVAAPLVKEVLVEALPIIGVKRDLIGQIPREIRLWIDKPSYVVPNFIGMDPDDIKGSPFYFVNEINEGSRVIAQIPKAGELIEEGGTIIIYIN